ncbi:TPA: hypothetical protein RQJ48_003619 [Vibrio vulnificus]|nr:hypothetical protein [Vibrio vulnificus]
MILILRTLLKDFTQSLSLDSLIKEHPACFEYDERWKLMPNKPVAVHADVHVTSDLRYVVPEGPLWKQGRGNDYSLSDWLVDELSKVGFPIDYLVAVSVRYYIWDGHDSGSKIMLEIMTYNTKDP